MVCAIAGFSWQIHAAALKTTQAFVAKLQEAESASVLQEQVALFMGLIPGNLAHSSYTMDSKHAGCMTRLGIDVLCTCSLVGQLNVEIAAQRCVVMQGW